MAKIETTVLAVRDLASNERFAACEDPHHLLDFAPCKLKAYASNPFLPAPDAPCRLIGVKDGMVVGCRNSFPGKFVADGKSHDNRISGSVYVDPRCRASLYALTLLHQALKFPGGELNINCWMSRQNQKFYRLFGSGMIRFVAFDAGGRWSRYLQKVTFPRWKAIVAVCVNQVAAFACAFLDGRRWRGLPAWSVRMTERPDDWMLAEACELVCRDSHRYRQEITPDWIRWTLGNDFKESRRKLFVRVCAGDSLVGFALVRVDIRAKFNKIYEWQVASQYAAQEADFLSVVARQIQKYGCRVQVAVGADNGDVVARLRERFPATSENYAAITIAEGSRYNGFPGIKDSRNWRARPGMGDASLW